MMALDLDVLVSALDGRIYRNVGGYEEKYFPNIGSTSILDSDTAGIDATLLRSPKTLTDWLKKLGDLSTPELPQRFVVDHANREFPGVKLHLVRHNDNGVKRTPLTSGALVVGLLLQDRDVSSKDEAVPMLCSLVSHIFTARPERLFIHGFLIHDCIVEAWTLDRAGAYAGKAFDITQEPDRFRAMVTEYMTMNDEKLGLNPFLQGNAHGVFFDLHLRNQAMQTRLHLDHDAFVKQDYLVGPGTTCFKARANDAPDLRFVVKYTWNEIEDSAEKRLLELTAIRDVRGVVQLEAFHDLTNTAFMRRGLSFGQPVKFQGDKSLVEAGEETKFDNLHLKCVVTSPLGRSLDTFSSVSELLAVLRDAVKALSSLYFRANILHRDISTRNIVIADNEGGPTGLLIDLDYALDMEQPLVEKRLVGSEGFMAVGILGGDDHTYRHDLESVFYVFLWLAICYESSVRIPPHSRLQAWVGHDFLASFHAKMKDLDPAVFSVWTKTEFTRSFEPYLPLANDLHKLLFPIRNGKFFIGTDSDDLSASNLYSGMVSAFEKHII